MTNELRRRGALGSIATCTILAVASACSAEATQGTPQGGGSGATSAAAAPSGVGGAAAAPGGAGTPATMGGAAPATGGAAPATGGAATTGGAAPATGGAAGTPPATGGMAGTPPATGGAGMAGTPPATGGAGMAGTPPAAGGAAMAGSTMGGAGASAGGAATAGATSGAGMGGATGDEFPADQCSGISTNPDNPNNDCSDRGGPGTCSDRACAIADLGRRNCTCDGATWSCESCAFPCEDTMCADDPILSVPETPLAECAADVDKDVEGCTLNDRCMKGEDLCVCYMDDVAVWDCDDVPNFWE